MRMGSLLRWLSVLAAAAAVSCAGSGRKYHDPNMDFGSIRTVAVLPFANLTGNQAASDRVRDVFSNALLSTGAVYVLPPGEVARAVSRAAIQSPTSPSNEEIVKLAGVLKVDAIITGVVKEYGEVRAASAASNVISVSLQLQEASTGKVVWSASTTKGGVSFKDRLLGSGGVPLNNITEEAVDDLLRKLFK